VYFNFIYDLDYGSDYSEDLNTSNKIKTIQIRIVNYCKESKTEKDLVIKKLPITMTLHRLRELGNHLFKLGNKQIELSYITKEVKFILNYIICIYACYSIYIIINN